MSGDAVASPGPLRIWWLAIRPKTLSLALVPVLVGSVLAWAESGRFDPLTLAAILGAALLIQIGTNLHNDAGDFLRGADTPERVGPRRATAEGWLGAGQVLAAAYGAFAGAFLLGVHLAWLGGWPVVAIGLASLAAGYGYTGGVRPIAYSAAGELFVLLFFGLAAVAGTYYLQAGTWSPAALLAGAAVGAIAAAVLMVNNYRDLDSDRRVGKRTLAVRLGRRRSRRLYAVLLVLPWPLPFALDLGPFALLPLLALPAALGLVRRFFREAPGPAFNAILAGTARLQLHYGLLLCAALLLARW